MTVGLQCFDEDGYMYFDTSVRNYYRLLGRLRSRRISGTIDKSTLTVPSIYDNNNHLFVLELPSGQTRYGEMYVGAYYEGADITFTIQNSDTEPTPLPSLLVYTLNPVNSIPDTYGIQVFDEQMNTTFSAHSSTALLQIEDYVVASTMQHGIIGRGNAVLVTGMPFYSQGRSPYYSIVASSFRTDGQQVKASGTIVHRVTRQTYNYSQPYFAVATVYVPPIIVNDLPW